jgi:hypothetical protein
LAGEDIAFERRQTGRGTATERAAAGERGRLESDVRAGATFKDVILRYGNVLSTSEIRSIYNESSRYEAATESEATVLEWIEGEEETDKSDPQYWKDRGYSDEDAAILASIS